MLSNETKLILNKVYEEYVKERDRIVKMAESRDEFVMGDDGYVYWWPRAAGAISASELRTLALELDERNTLARHTSGTKPWDRQVQRDIEKNDQVQDT